MRILYLSQYFPPEIGATQTRAYEMARGLVRAGHSVTMIAEFPNHPTGIIPPEYRGKLWQYDTLDGIDVIRIWVKASSVKNFRTRITFYLSYMLMAALAGLFLARGKYNALYATSPPLFVGGAALVISYLRRLPLFFEVRDLWPESAVTLGELRNPRFIGWAVHLEEACYKQARKIIVTAQEIIDRLVERDILTEKIALIRNGANVELFKPNAEIRKRIRSQLSLNDKFIVLYAGLHGLAYDLEGVLDVASALQNKPDIHFLFVGDGPTKEQTQRHAQALALENITFLSSQLRETIPDFFNAADISIVPMREPHIMGTLPIKIYDSMACNVPVIVATVGEAKIILEKAQAGIFIEPENPEAMENAILTLKQNPTLRQQMGENGRRAVEQKYSRQTQAQQLVDLLTSTLTD